MLAHPLSTRILLPLAASAVILGLLALLLRRRAPLWTFPLLVVGLPMSLLHLVPGIRIIGWHNLMHSAIVYQVRRDGFENENPLMAG